MSTNPFTLPTTYLAEQQQMRRERVKLTVYTVLGCMVILCLGLLFQGCRTHSASAENPLVNREPAQVAALQPAKNPSHALTPLPESPAKPMEVAPLTLPTTTPAAAVPSPSVVKAPAPAPASSESIYVIKKGDSLTSIARAHRTTIQAIQAANNLSNDRIVVGKTLKIPVQS